MKNFQYSRDFENLIVNLHRGKENRPRYKSYINDHLGGPSSRLIQFSRSLFPEIVYHCGEIKNKKILDFGCGTGASSVILAQHCDSITAFDVDKESLEICKKRLSEHGLDANVHLLCAKDLSDRKNSLGTFDLILINGVIEHIPLSKPGLRKKVLLSLFDLLRKGGYLFINDTPNRLWPFDFHTTGLWLIPWTKPGSKWAYKRAVKKGLYYDPPKNSPGSLGLEEAGAWGATYWEIKRYLNGKKYLCQNLLKGYNKHIYSTSEIENRRKKLFYKIFEILIYIPAKLIRAPITALEHKITNLVIKKC